jgi:OHCU decarboxylase
VSTPISQAEFVARYGGVYEHSAWIAEASWQSDQSFVCAEALATAMAAVVDAASPEQRLALIRAHPDLAGRIAIAGELTEDSTSEQSSAGLDHCSNQEFKRFQKLNQAYVEKFAFPFVMAVRGSNREDILTAFSKRLENSYEQEFATAIQQVHKIAHMRLEQLF